MPFPAILFGAAALAIGGYGAKKTVDAVRTNNKADEVYKDAEKIVEKALAKKQTELGRNNSNMKWIM